MPTNSWRRKELIPFLKRVYAQLRHPDPNEAASLAAECTSLLEDLGADLPKRKAACPRCTEGFIAYVDGYVVCQDPARDGAVGRPLACGYNFGLTAVRREIEALDPRLGIFILLHRHRHGEDTTLVLSNADRLDFKTAKSFLDADFELNRGDQLEIIGPDRLRHILKAFTEDPAKED